MSPWTAEELHGAGRAGARLASPGVTVGGVEGSLVTEVRCWEMMKAIGHTLEEGDHTGRVMGPRGRSTQKQKYQQVPRSLQVSQICSFLVTFPQQPPSSASPAPQSVCPELEMVQSGCADSPSPLRPGVHAWSHQPWPEGGLAWHNHSSAGPSPWMGEEVALRDWRMEPG